MSSKINFTAKNLPKAIGPYSPMLQYGNLFFISGQLGLDPVTGNLVEGFEAQVNQILKNARVLMQTANLDFKNVLQTTVYLTDISKFQIMNEIYAKYLTEPFPARAVVEVSKVPKGALVEMAFIAGK
jgi:2-iminobutanoate/2-iminopropanoate deaminase